MISSTISRSVLRAALVASLALGVTVPGAASAQDRGNTSVQGEGRGTARRGDRGHRRRGRRHGPRATLRQLDLTENQQAQVRAIMETARDRRREIARAGRSDATRAQLRALRQETRTLIEDVLTPAQKRKAAELRAAHRAERLERKMSRMTERLSLSESQTQRVRSIFEAAQTRRQALRASNTAHEQKRAQMQALREQTLQRVRAVLSAEQQAQFDELQSRREARRGRR